MSLNSRLEMVDALRPAYTAASWKEKKELLDSLIAATDYNRKYAIRLLNGYSSPNAGKRVRKFHYGRSTKEALIKVWLAANRICSKRLQPFLPIFLESLERNGHLKVSSEVRQKLLQLSASTIDRLLKDERKKHGRAVSTTKPATGLKKTIPVRALGTPSPSRPGSCEADLVAHNGGVIEGSCIHTLTVTDISTGWTELEALERKGDQQVLDALKVLRARLPFELLALHTDNGGEFLNHLVSGFCSLEGIDFTRGRKYRKNDQAHVEEKNGSVVRKLVGYDRYTRAKARSLLSSLYHVARLYINFFQPCMKLVSKDRLGAKTIKKYDSAKTPFERVLLSDVDERVKENLRNIAKTLDPVDLLDRISHLQRQLWKTKSLDTNAPALKSKPARRRERDRKRDKKRPRPHKQKGRKPISLYDKEIYAELTHNPNLGPRDLMKLLKARHHDLSISELTVRRRVVRWQKQNLHR